MDVSHGWDGVDVARWGPRPRTCEILSVSRYLEVMLRRELSTHCARTVTVIVICRHLVRLCGAPPSNLIVCTRHLRVAVSIPVLVSNVELLSSIVWTLTCLISVQAGLFT